MLLQLLDGRFPAALCLFSEEIDGFVCYNMVDSSEGTGSFMKRTPIRFSLRMGLACIIVVCWMLPIATIGSITEYYITHNISDQIVSTVTSSVGNSVKIAMGQLDSSVSASRYASYNPAVKNAYAEYRLTRDDAALYDRITSFLSQQYKYDDKFLLTTLYFCDRPETVYYTYNETYNATYFGVREYRDSVHAPVQKLSGALGADIGFLNVSGRVYMVRNILDSDYRPYAVLAMQLNVDDIFAGLKNIVWATGTTIWLDDTPVVLNGQRSDPGSLGIEFIQNSQTYRNIGGASYLYGRYRSDPFTLSYVAAVDSSSLVREMSGFQTALIWVLISLFPLLAVVIWFFTRNVTRPIGRLIETAGSIENGNFGVQVRDRFRSSEFEYLKDAFNSMSHRLKYQFDRIYREELALRDARIMALQSQINPHFLNNTLESINWEARLSKNVKISQMIEALSTMLDAAMDRKGKPVVHVSEELMYVDAYLFIISERFGRRLTVRKEIDPELLDLYVPRLVLQPIIENAVEHGIRPQQKGEIAIRVFREEENLVVEVENSGRMTEEDEGRIARLLSDDADLSGESSGNLGIRNVNQRLKIIYGEKSGLSIKMNSQGHAVSRILIAIEQSKQ